MNMIEANEQLSNNESIDIISVRANILNSIIAILGIVYMIFTLNFFIASLFMYACGFLYFLATIFKEYSKKITDSFLMNKRVTCLNVVRIIFIIIYLLFAIAYLLPFYDFVDYHFSGDVLLLMDLQMKFGIFLEFYAFFLFLPGFLYKYYKKKKHMKKT